jgi:hypothetical protein
MTCDLCESGKVVDYKCKCQYVKVEPMLRAKILAKLTPQELDPDSYGGMESWDWTEVDGVQYDLNFWFDGDDFIITAYFLTEEDGRVVRDNTKFFRILSKAYKLEDDEYDHA